MTEAPVSTLLNKEKAAILLISLGKNAASLIYKNLDAEEIEDLTFEISRIRRVSAETRNEILSEFYEICLAKNYINSGGIDYAREVLEDAIGNDKAIEIIQRLTTTLQAKPFDFIRKTDPNHLLSLIQHESPQTIALVFSYLPPAQSAALLAALPSDRQVEIAERIALIDRTSPEYIKEVERVLERKLTNMGLHEYTTIDGIQTIVDIINSVDRGTEKNIIESLSIENSDLAEEILKRMFVFEDIIKLQEKHIQRILREVDTSDITLALKGAPREVAECIFRNVSKRLRLLIEEDMQYMGPVRLKVVEEAQQKIVNTIRRLEEEGEIIVSHGQDDELIG